jgi:antitoxin component of RelBE/YafQ-DinJ toxin-antitoxin module
MCDKNMVTIEIQLNADLKDEAEKILAAQGYTLEDAILLFIHETVRLGRFPFEVTEEMIKEAKSN